MNSKEKSRVVETREANNHDANDCTLKLNDLQAEKSVLGCCLLNDEARIIVLETLRDDDFFDTRHRIICKHIRKLHETGTAPDFITLTDSLRKSGELAKVEPDYISVLTVTVVSPERAKDHAGVVLKLSTDRMTSRIGQELAENPGKRFACISRLSEIELRKNPISTVEPIWTATELLRMKFPPVSWLVPDLLMPGLTILAGRPKVGKSWLMLQLCHAVGTGGMFLDRRVKQGHTFYIALEDNKGRCRKRFENQGIPETDQISGINSWEPLHQGGLEHLRKEIEANDFKLICIDTLSMLAGRLDQDSVSSMTALLAPLRQLAQEHNISVLLCDHHKKSGGFEGSEIDDILGSTAKSAVADSIWGLYRERGRAGAVLKVVGRDLEGVELALEFDGSTRCWHSLGPAGSVRRDTIASDILQIVDLHEKIGTPIGVTGIAAALGKDKGNICRELNELISRGELNKLPKKGRFQCYGLPGKKSLLPS